MDRRALRVVDALPRERGRRRGPGLRWVRVKRSCETERAPTGREGEKCSVLIGRDFVTALR